MITIAATARKHAALVRRNALSPRMRLGSDMSRIRRTTQALHAEAKRHIAAARAFHTGLIAESQKHLHLLARFTRHIDVPHCAGGRAFGSSETNFVGSLSGSAPEANQNGV